MVTVARLSCFCLVLLSREHQLACCAAALLAQLQSLNVLLFKLLKKAMSNIAKEVQGWTTTQRTSKQDWTRDLAQAKHKALTKGQYQGRMGEDRAIPI